MTVNDLGLVAQSGLDPGFGHRIIGQVGALVKVSPTVGHQQTGERLIGVGLGGEGGDGARGGQQRG